jgi:hypothetical protein
MMLWPLLLYSLVTEKVSQNKLPNYPAFFSSRLIPLNAQNMEKEQVVMFNTNYCQKQTKNATCIMAMFSNMVECLLQLQDWHQTADNHLTSNALQYKTHLIFNYVLTF